MEDAIIARRAIERARAWGLPVSRAAQDVGACAVLAHSRLSVAALQAANAVGLRSAMVAPDTADRLAAHDALAIGVSVHSMMGCSFEGCAAGRRARIVAHIDGGGSGLPPGLDPLLACSRCRVAWYCGAACQRSHWAAHKTRCALVAEQRRAGGASGAFVDVSAAARSRATAFAKVTLSSANAAAFYAVLAAAWAVRALLVELDDEALVLGAPTAAVALPMMITPWVLRASQDRPAGERAVVQRLRSRNVDAALASLLLDERAPTSVALVFATRSGDLGKATLLPIAARAFEVFAGADAAAARRLASLNAIVVEPCVDDHERRAAGRDPVAAAVHLCMQPSTEAIRVPTSLRFCVVFGLSLA